MSDSSPTPHKHDDAPVDWDGKAFLGLLLFLIVTGFISLPLLR